MTTVTERPESGLRIRVKKPTLVIKFVLRTTVLFTTSARQILDARYRRREKILERKLVFRDTMLDLIFEYVKIKWEISKCCGFYRK